MCPYKYTSMIYRNSLTESVRLTEKDIKKISASYKEFRKDVHRLLREGEVQRTKTDPFMDNCNPILMYEEANNSYIRVCDTERNIAIVGGKTSTSLRVLTAGKRMKSFPVKQRLNLIDAVKGLMSDARNKVVNLLLIMKDLCKQHKMTFFTLCLIVLYIIAMNTDAFKLSGSDDKTPPLLTSSQNEMPVAGRTQTLPVAASQDKLPSVKHPNQTLPDAFSRQIAVSQTPKPNAARRRFSRQIAVSQTPKSNDAASSQNSNPLWCLALKMILPVTLLFWLNEKMKCGWKQLEQLELKDEALKRHQEEWAERSAEYTRNHRKNRNTYV